MICPKCGWGVQIDYAGCHIVCSNPICPFVAKMTWEEEKQ